jgi:hypothetical protein
MEYIAPINHASKFGPIPCPMDTFYGNQGRGNHIRNQKKKQKTKKKPTMRINILDEG